MFWAGPPVESSYSPYGSGHYNYQEEEKKRVLSPPGQRTNDTINTFGLRVPEKGTHWHRKGQPALICRTWAWLPHGPPQPTL